MGTPLPKIVTPAYAGGYCANGTLILTLDELNTYDPGATGRGRERRYKCPFCGGDERAFDVNVQSGLFNCKRSTCGVKGRLYDFWPESPKLTGRSRQRAALSRAFGLDPAPLAPKVDPQEAEDSSNWKELWEKAAVLIDADAQAGRDYLTVRGLDVETALAAGVRFSRNWAPSSEGKRYQAGAAVLFPLRDKSGQLCAVNGRYLSPKPNAEGKITKTRTGGALGAGLFCVPALVGDEWVSPLKCESPVVVEGPADALAVAASGAPAIAINGVNLQAWLPAAFAFKAPFLAPDSDEAGNKALTCWEAEISPFAPRCSRLQPEGKKDFGEIVQENGSGFLRSWLQAKGVLSAPSAPVGTPTFVRANDFVYLPAHPKSDAEQLRHFEQQLAREILAGAYFNQADNVWCIGWATPGRHAWQRLCLDQGGALDENGAPDLAAAAAIEWAKARESRNNAAVSN